MSWFGSLMLSYVVLAVGACSSSGGADASGGRSNASGGSAGSGGAVSAGGSGGNGTGGPSTAGTGAGSGGADPCGACVEDECSAQLDACDADPDCVAMGECFWNCADNDSACFQSCYEQYPSAQPLDDAIFDCMDAKCSTECS